MIRPARGLLLLVAALMLIYPAYVFDRWAVTFMGVAISMAYFAGLIVGREGKR